MSQQLVLDSNLEEAKNFARIMYFAHAITFFFSLGMLSFIPLIVNYAGSWSSLSSVCWLPGSCLVSHGCGMHIA
jgi:hypothetical protein